MYERLLIPTDGSDGSERAVRHAIELAGQYDGVLHVLSVVDKSEFRALEGVDAEAIREARESDAASVADRARDAGLEVVTAIRTGPPVETITGYADEEGIDMIVMGTHGRTGVDRVLLGSVAEGVIRTASVPVVTVRLTDGHGPRTSDRAVEHARETMEQEGHDTAELAEEPYRTSGSWVVPMTAADGTYHVHVDATDGETRIARLD